MHDQFPSASLPFSPELLVRPFPHRDEGPRGYLLRLAEANCLSVNDLSRLGIRYDPECLSRQRLLPEPVLDPVLHAHVARMAALVRSKPRVWNQRYCRFCPRCLEEWPIWMAAWEMYFYDVCYFHGTWLVDRCSSCNRPISWNRESLLRCQCGSDLTQEKSGSAPLFSGRLSAALRVKLLQQLDSKYGDPIDSLDVEQFQRLVRYLGTYLDPEAEPKPLKLRHLASIEFSWQVSSLASEIIFQWPHAMHYVLDLQQKNASSGAKTSLASVFRHAYLYLYKGLSEAAFSPVRDAFECWLAEHWKGGLAMRNRRLTLDLLEKVQWIPGSVAAKELGISMARLHTLIGEGKVEGQISVSASGRRFTMVRRDRLQDLHLSLIDEVTMYEALECLGVSKLRMQRLVRLLFPTARHVNDQAHLPWCVPRKEVEALLGLGGHLAIVGIPEEHQVSLGHVLRYWNWSGDEIVALIESVKSGQLIPCSFLETARGIARWVFDIAQLRTFRSGLSEGRVKWLSVVEIATILNVKQAVAYWLVHQGIITAQSIGGPKGASFKVRRDELDQFCQQYIFGREVAAILGCSPRKSKLMLAEHGLNPLRIDGVAPCRQLVYPRTPAMQQFLDQVAGSKTGGFKLVTAISSDEARNIAKDGIEAVVGPTHGLQRPDSPE